jgi:hypothetical protein
LTNGLKYDKLFFTRRSKMKLYRYLILIITAFSMAVLFNIPLSLAQNNTATQSEALLLGEPDILWLWGEVILIDVEKGIISVKYLDYETDTEKEAVIYVDDKTTYENAKAIIDIKPKDIVSIDYITGAQGSSIARNVSVEKPEDIQATGEGTAADEGLKPAVMPDTALTGEGAIEVLPKAQE